jgi:hypothetical protein
MRIVFFTWPARLQRFTGVVLELARRGHDVVVASPAARVAPLPPQLARAGVSLVAYDDAADAERTRAVELLRLARDYAWYLLPAHDGNEFNRRRALDFLVRAASRGARGADAAWADPVLAAAPEERDAVASALAWLEGALPPPREVEAVVDELAPDVALVTPLVLAGSLQHDVVKAAQRRGTPVGFLVWSWDNLSNKGVIAVEPDATFVWNDVQRREVEELHCLDPARVAVTGAPRWDDFFPLEPSVGREEFCRRHGFDPDEPVVLYTGSSSAICPDETLVVERWLEAVRGAGGRAARANVLVRPHPRETEMWSGWAPDRPRVAFERFPRVGDQDLFDELHHSSAVVGLNTSAQIEASIVGRPILTFSAGALAPGQEGSLHFRYLLREHGGPVVAARTLEAHVEDLERTLGGDADAEAIRAFAASFVRPRGVDRPVAPLLADEIERLSRAGGARGGVPPAAGR